MRSTISYCFTQELIMGWSRPVQNPITKTWSSHRSDRGQNESLHGKLQGSTPRKGISQTDHVHYHKDGATITKNGQKTQLPKSNK